MTEQPDTAEFRRLLATDELPAVDVLDLIQALDAARAKEFHHRELIGHLKGRAEAAEARIAAALAWFARTVREDVLALDEANAMLRTALARAEAAEARIAAALAWFARTDCTWTYRVEMAHRALTEGTGQ